MIFSMVVLAQHGDVAHNFFVVRLAKHKLIVSVDAVVGVKLLATTLAGKHMATVLPNFVLARHCQRCQQMSTPLKVLLKADPRLEGDVADDKADPLVCQQLNKISVL
jgi:hypothetical protein